MKTLFIVSAESSFPYVKKRILVSDTHTEEKSPIEVAIEEMQNRVNELNEIVSAKTCDSKKLQLRYYSVLCCFKIVIIITVCIFL